MDFEPPSAMTRFGMFFLAGGIAAIFAMWGILRWLDHPHPPAPVRPQETPVLRPSPTPAVARPAPSLFPPPATPA